MPALSATNALSLWDSKRATGIPVHLPTTSAISSAVTLLRSNRGWLSSSGASVSTLAVCHPKQTLFQIRDNPVLKLRHARQITFTSRRLELQTCRLNSSLVSCEPLRACFSDSQISSSAAYSFSMSAISPRKSLKALFAGLIAFFLKILPSSTASAADPTHPYFPASSPFPSVSDLRPRQSDQWLCPAVADR